MCLKYLEILPPLVLLSVCFGHWASTNTWLWKQTLPQDLCKERMLFEFNNNNFSQILPSHIFVQWEQLYLCLRAKYLFLCISMSCRRTKESFAARSFICSDRCFQRRKCEGRMLWKKGTHWRKAATYKKKSTQQRKDTAYPRKAPTAEKPHPQRETTGQKKLQVQDWKEENTLASLKDPLP